MPAAPWHIIVHLWEKSRSTPESSDVLAVDYKALLHVSFLFQPEWMQFLNSLRYGMCSCPLASLVPPTGLAPVCLSVLYWGAQRWMQCSSAVTQALRRGDRAILGPADCLLCCEATLLAPCRFFSTQVKRSPGTFYRDASQVVSPQPVLSHSSSITDPGFTFAFLGAPWGSQQLFSPVCSSHSEQQPCPPAHRPGGWCCPQTCWDCAQSHFPGH